MSPLESICTQLETVDAVSISMLLAADLVQHTPLSLTPAGVRWMRAVDREIRRRPASMPRSTFRMEIRNAAARELRSYATGSDQVKLDDCPPLAAGNSQVFLTSSAEVRP